MSEQQHHDGAPLSRVRTVAQFEADGRRVQCLRDDDCEQDVTVFGVSFRVIAIRKTSCACGARLCAHCTPEDETECLECHRARGCDHYGYPCVGTE